MKVIKDKLGISRRGKIILIDGYEIPYHLHAGWFYEERDRHFENGFKYDAHFKACFPLEYFSKENRAGDGYSSLTNYTVHIRRIQTLTPKKVNQIKREKEKSLEHYYFTRDHGSGAGPPKRYANWVLKFGLTWEQAYYFDTTIKECQCCGVDNKKLVGVYDCFSFDHCHSSLRVRGFICNACNVTLGYFSDDIDLLRQHHRNYLADYLERTKDVDLRETKVFIIVPTKHKLFGNKNEANN